MTPEFVASFSAEAIWVAIKLAGPLLAVALVVGLLVSLFQAVTQIQEMTLAIIPKMMAVVAVLIMFLPWFLDVASSYMTKVLTNLPMYMGMG